FTDIRTRLARRGATLPEQALNGRSRDALIGLLQARAQAMFDILIGPPLGLHGTLLQREMCDPSEALPVIVDEIIRPMLGEVEQILSRLEPALSRDQVRRSAFSTMAQVLFYRFTMPATLRLMGRDVYPPGLSRTVAEHITHFSLGGLQRLATNRRT